MKWVLKKKIFDYFQTILDENNRSANITRSIDYFDEDEKQVLRKNLISCYKIQQNSLGMSKGVKRGSIVPEEKIKGKIIIQNPEHESYPYKTLIAYFYAIRDLYFEKYRHEPIDEFVEKTVFCGILTNMYLTDVNYVRGGKKTKRNKRKSKKTKKRYY